MVHGEYLAVWPVFVVGASDEQLTFTVAVDDVHTLDRIQEEPHLALATGEPADEGRRRYITSVTRIRLHQREFRERVLRTYQRRCATCRLAHAELLDAAHIIADAEVGGDPQVRNGIALCKLHHAAFDAHLLGVTPGYALAVREDVLGERDGPVLLHGLRGLNGQTLQLPRARQNWPDRARLAQRFEVFQRAG